jgi:2-dehydropantoate 2-reductase
MRAVVNFGVNLVAPGHVKMAFHKPPHYLQELDESSVEVARSVCELFTEAGLPTNHSEKLVDVVWQKTIMNAALNPVCAVTGKTMSEAMHDPGLRETVENIVREGIRIARANEISVGWDYYRHSIGYLSSAGDHKPSMLVDVENKRGTEIEYINGKIVQYAEIAGETAPYNSMIRALVKGLKF